MSTDLDDLSVRARRGLLSRAEVKRFEASLAGRSDAEKAAFYAGNFARLMSLPDAPAAREGVSA